MFFRRRYPNAVSLFLITGSILLLTVMLKHLYDNNQKYNRIKNYKQLIQELSDHMLSVEQAANKSATNIHQLNTVLMQQHQRYKITSQDENSNSKITISTRDKN